jgi:hypothetical protein
MIRKTALALLVATTFAVLALTQASVVRATTKFDGQWSVVVYTSSGPCDPSYRLSGQIQNGEISYAYGSVEISGHIEPNGAAHVHVTAGSGHGEAHGHMTPSHGSGTWSGEGPDGRCAGTWVATRPGTS